MNPDFVRVAPAEAPDLELILRLLRQHAFHTGSRAAEELVASWASRRGDFAKVVPIALDIVDFRAIHDASVESRLGVLLNE